MVDLQSEGVVDLGSIPDVIGPPSYGMATAGPGSNARGGQETVPQCLAGYLYLLRHMDKVQHVSSCG